MPILQLLAVLVPLHVGTDLPVTPSIPQEDAHPGIRAPWPQDLGRVWIGPEFFANRLGDWRLEDGTVQCVQAGARRGLRTLHWLTRSLSGTRGPVYASVEVHADPDGAWMDGALAGFLIGAGGDHVDPRLTAMVHSLPAEDGGLLAVLESDGRVALRDHSRDSGVGSNWSVAAEITPGMIPLLPAEERWGPGFGSDGPVPVRLVLEIDAGEGGQDLVLRALRLSDGEFLSGARARGVDVEQVNGCLALVSHLGTREAKRGFSFRAWEAKGEGVLRHPDRAFGPVLGALHTLHDGTLRLTAQMGVLGDQDDRDARLEVRAAQPSEDAEWLIASIGEYVPGSCTVPFVVEGWDGTQDWEYRICYSLNLGEGQTRRTEYLGRIRRDPTDAETFVLAAFTGHKCYTGGLRWNSQGFWFPHADIHQAVAEHDPDLLFFSGDQIYEGDFDPAVRSPETDAVYDYLYKWTRWCWAFRDLTRDRPTVCIPDDHDVYQGNVWGAGGVSGEPHSPKFYAHDRGGYTMGARFVNVVHRTQTSHLPPAHDPRELPGGVQPYHTLLRYGGLSWAILADRMWKSAPAVVLTEGECKNGWFQDPSFDPVTQADAPQAQLLGPAQEGMLESWAGDWSGGTWMKVVLSQTLFANVATLPVDQTTDGNTAGLLIQPPGGYAKGERLVADADSNGWPQTPRDRALRSMRKGFAVHVAGDQHLGSTVRYGIDSWDDAGYALCVPSVANTFPRRWFPPEPGEGRLENAPRYTGRYLDGFGNPVTVHAVSNPRQTGIAPEGLHDRAPGYGIVRFDRATRQVTLECWPRSSVGGGPQYEGWPVTFSQTDGYGRRPATWLPEVRVHGVSDPVFRLEDTASGELIYALRPGGAVFQPWCFSADPVTLEVGEPGSEAWARIEGLSPELERPEQTLEVHLEFD